MLREIKRNFSSQSLPSLSDFGNLNTSTSFPMMKGVSKFAKKTTYNNIHDSASLFALKNQISVLRDNLKDRILQDPER